MKERDPFVQRQIKSPNTNPQAIKLNPSCSGQVHSNRPGTDYGYEITKPGCVLIVLSIPFIIYSIVPSITLSADATSARLRNKFRAAGTNRHLDLILFIEHLRTQLKYDRGQGMYGKPRKVVLLVGKT